MSRMYLREKAFVAGVLPGHLIDGGERFFFPFFKFMVSAQQQHDTLLL